MASPSSSPSKANFACLAPFDRLWPLRVSPRLGWQLSPQWSPQSRPPVGTGEKGCERGDEKQLGWQVGQWPLIRHSRLALSRPLPLPTSSCCCCCHSFKPRFSPVSRCLPFASFQQCPCPSPSSKKRRRCHRRRGHTEGGWQDEWPRAGAWPKGRREEN